MAAPQTDEELLKDEFEACLTLKETGCDSSKGAWFADCSVSLGAVFLTSIHDISIVDGLQDGEMLDIQWFLEFYAVKDPYQAGRATKARAALRRCEISLLSSLRPAFEALSKAAPAENTKLRVTLTIRASGDDSTFHSLLWETLERQEQYQSHHLCISVVRYVESNPDPPSIQFAPARNILLLTARPDQMMDQKYNLITKPISHLLWTTPNTSTRQILHFARPGTFNELQRRLEGEGKGYFSLVHLDVHGVVKNGRYACSSEGIGSAFSRGTVLQNFAYQVASAGIPAVLAMSFAVLSDSATKVMEEIYSHFIVSNESLLESVRKSRHTLRATSLRKTNIHKKEVEVDDFLNPVLYQSTTNRVYFPRQSECAIAQAETEEVLPINSAAHAGTFVNKNYCWPSERDAEQLAMEQALSVSRTVLLQGPSGIGKTAMAGWFAAWWTYTKFVEGCYYFDCLRRPDMLWPDGKLWAGIAALRHADYSGDPGQFLSRKLLIVIDNFEIGLDEFGTVGVRRCLQRGFPIILYVKDDEDGTQEPEASDANVATPGSEEPNDSGNNTAFEPGSHVAAGSGRSSQSGDVVDQSLTTVGVYKAGSAVSVTEGPETFPRSSLGVQMRAMMDFLNWNPFLLITVGHPLLMRNWPVCWVEALRTGLPAPASEALQRILQQVPSILEDATSRLHWIGDDLYLLAPIISGSMLSVFGFFQLFHKEHPLATIMLLSLSLFRKRVPRRAWKMWFQFLHSTGLSAMYQQNPFVKPLHPKTFDNYDYEEIMIVNPEWIVSFGECARMLAVTGLGEIVDQEDDELEPPEILRLADILPFILRAKLHQEEKTFHRNLMTKVQEAFVLFYECRLRAFARESKDTFLTEIDQDFDNIVTAAYTYVLHPHYGLAESAILDGLIMAKPQGHDSMIQQKTLFHCLKALLEVAVSYCARRQLHESPSQTLRTGTGYLIDKDGTPETMIFYWSWYCMRMMIRIFDEGDLHRDEIKYATDAVCQALNEFSNVLPQAAFLPIFSYCIKCLQTVFQDPVDLETLNALLKVEAPSLTDNRILSCYRRGKIQVIEQYYKRLVRMSSNKKMYMSENQENSVFYGIPFDGRSGFISQKTFEEWGKIGLRWAVEPGEPFTMMSAALDGTIELSEVADYYNARLALGLSNPGPDMTPELRSHYLKLLELSKSSRLPGADSWTGPLKELLFKAAVTDCDLHTAQILHQELTELHNDPHSDWRMVPEEEASKLWDIGQLVLAKSSDGKESEASETATDGPRFAEAKVYFSQAVDVIRPRQGYNARLLEKKICESLFEIEQKIGSELSWYVHMARVAQMEHLLWQDDLIIRPYMEEGVFLAHTVGWWSPLGTRKVIDDALSSLNGWTSSQCGQLLGQLVAVEVAGCLLSETGERCEEVAHILYQEGQDILLNPHGRMRLVQQFPLKYPPLTKEDDNLGTLTFWQPTASSVADDPKASDADTPSQSTADHASWKINTDALVHLTRNSKPVTDELQETYLQLVELMPHLDISVETSGQPPLTEGEASAPAVAGQSWASVKDG
ncbi:hypothetical protein AYO22_01959 [Fonsecaea multimorphosa]|nr:hypothetical protein AYO22_01959 [Fonsecaea multimorphosa]